MDSASYIVYSAVDGNYAPNKTVQTFTGYKQFCDPNRNAKIYKALPHLFLPEHEWSIWIDSNVTLNVAPEEIIQMSQKDVAVFAHWERDCVYEEAIAARTRDNPDTIDAQIERYKNKGYPAHNGLGMCFLIVRRNTDEVARLNEQWWAEISVGSRRDQLSFPYVYGDAVHYYGKIDYTRPNKYFTRA